MVLVVNRLSIRQGLPTSSSSRIGWCRQKAPTRRKSRGFSFVSELKVICKALFVHFHSVWPITVNNFLLALDRYVPCFYWKVRCQTSFIFFTWAWLTRCNGRRILSPVHHKCVQDVCRVWWLIIGHSSGQERAGLRYAWRLSIMNQEGRGQGGWENSSLYSAHGFGSFSISFFQL